MTTISNKEGHILQLFEAVRIGEYQRIEELLASGLGVNTTDSTGKSALMVAAHEGLPETMGLLLKHGATVDSQDENGNTPLHWAVEMYDLAPSDQCLLLLIEAGANLEARNHNGQTPLLKCAGAAVDYYNHYAGVVDYARGLVLLVEVGADTKVLNDKQESVRDILNHYPEAFDPHDVRAAMAALDRALLEDQTPTGPRNAAARRI